MAPEIEMKGAAALAGVFPPAMKAMVVEMILPVACMVRATMAEAVMLARGMNGQEIMAALPFPVVVPAGAAAMIAKETAIMALAPAVSKAAVIPGPVAMAVAATMGQDMAGTAQAHPIMETPGRAAGPGTKATFTRTGTPKEMSRRTGAL